MVNFVEKVSEKYPYLDESDVKNIVDKAKSFYYALRYPDRMDIDIYDTPIEGFRAEQWVLACCDEIIERVGASSAIAVRENGVSIEFGSSQLSPMLISLIKPVIGVIK